VAAFPGPSRKPSTRRTDDPFRFRSALILRRPLAESVREAAASAVSSHRPSGDCKAATGGKCCGDKEVSVPVLRPPHL